MKMKILNYNIILRPEPEGGFTVFVPSLPGCITYGRDIKEAREMAVDAIRAYVASLRKHHEPIPSDEDNVIASIQVPLPSLLKEYA
jgi:predicted RNase H-like HicB family nuclease